MSTNPTTGEETITYCHAPAVEVEGFNDYPYPQPYRPAGAVVLRDPLTPFIESDMFYYPKQVTSWEEQAQKWLQTFIWQFSPLIFIVFTLNFWTYTIDFWANVFSGKPEEWGAYPRMYNNFFVKWVHSMENGNEIWGPFVWYDMFSWQGLFDYWFNLQMINFLFVFEIIFAAVRDD